MSSEANKKRIALVQTTSVEDFDKNFQFALNAIKEAANNGASLVAFPENFLFLGIRPDIVQARAPKVDEHDHPILKQFRDIAASRSITLLLGSIPEVIAKKEDEVNAAASTAALDETQQPSSPRRQKIYNTCYLINNKGEIVSKYRKIHLFDLKLPTVELLESKGVDPGRDIVVTKVDLTDPTNPHDPTAEKLPPVSLNLGLTVCYDLRFPNQFQELRERGADVIFVPSAFTVPTGEAHWMTLLRARAIETQCYVLAPAQVGKHNEKRESYGKTIAIDAWGTILDTAPDMPCIIYCDIDTELIQRVRAQMPVFSHRVSGIDYTAK